MKNESPMEKLAQLAVFLTSARRIAIDSQWRDALHRFEMIRVVSDNKLRTLQLVLLISVGLLLRLMQLGYSNLQGDEILALCKVSDFKSLSQFLLYLLGQQKGPVQYLVTCAIGIFDPAFSSELALRLPFAIANLLALACFFILVYRLFSLEIAIYSSFLFAVNGIFIAFARIVQYQSFVILGGVVGILGLTLALQSQKWRVTGLYLGFSAAALSLLAHFDGAFFMLPMAVLVLHWWGQFHHQPGFARLRWHLIAAMALFAFLVLGFYVPYALRLDAFQLNHWENRFTGDSTDILSLFRFYNPGPVLWICLGLVVLGVTQIRLSLGWQVILTWLLPALIFMVLIFNASRTHAYTYILPLFIVAGLGIDRIVGWLQSLLQGRSIQIVHATVLVMFLIFSYISYSIFIDHDPEYPWYPKRVLGMELDGGRLTGTFGFPYSREWREIGRWFEELPQDNKAILVTNEKQQFVTFYVPSSLRNMYKYSRKKFPEDIRAPHGAYVLIVHGPQSWIDPLWGWSLDTWRERLVALKDFVNDEGKVVASVYFLTAEQIQAEFH